MAQVNSLTAEDHALAKYNRLLREARTLGPLSARLQVGFAAAEAKENGLILTNPFDPAHEAVMFGHWAEHYANGYNTPIPTASISALKDWKPKPGSNACARSAVND